MATIIAAASVAFCLALCLQTAAALPPPTGIAATSAPVTQPTMTGPSHGLSVMFDIVAPNGPVVCSSIAAPSCSGVHGCLTFLCCFAAFTSLAPNKINVNITSYTVNNQTVQAGAPCTNMVPDNACLTQLKAARDMVHIDYSIKTGVRLEIASLSGPPCLWSRPGSAARLFQERQHTPVATDSKVISTHVAFACRLLRCLRPLPV